MNADARVLLEMIIRHGELEVPDLRTLTLVSEELTFAKEELAKRKCWGCTGHLKNRSYVSFYCDKKGKQVFHGLYVWTTNDNVFATERYVDGKLHGEAFYSSYKPKLTDAGYNFYANFDLCPLTYICRQTYHFGVLSETGDWIRVQSTKRNLNEFLKECQAFDSKIDERNRRNQEINVDYN